MKRKRYTEEKIISILKEHEAGASVPALSRRYGVAENTIYRSKSRFGGLEVSDVRRLRELEQENRKLNLLAEAELDKAALKELVKGKWRRLRSGAGPCNTSRVAASANVEPVDSPAFPARPPGVR
ncbi:MAG: transposase [Opitutaceae bacterium]